mgnify:CR=1 FL=1
MSEFSFRTMTCDDESEVAALICEGTNQWYQAHAMQPIFESHAAARVFSEVYEALDPGCCVLAVEGDSNRIAGSCFYHPRESHVSLGIMNVHPDFFGRGLASRLLRFVTTLADERQLPVRLVSSAMNLDSFSLYTRSGFVPRQAFQDMFLEVPNSGMLDLPAGSERVRDATMTDLQGIVALEKELVGIDRTQDFRFFIENASGIWHVSVLENAAGEIDGVLDSVNHPGSNMIGPGVFRDEKTALALILSELNHHAGRRPVFLVPVDCRLLVSGLYSRGARNCEIHFSQVRGDYQVPTGIVMPTFMPETG